VAFRFAKFPVPAFKVAMFAIVEVNDENTAVIALKILVASDPVTVRFDAVVEPIVEEPETARLAPERLPVDVRLLTVVEPRVLDPVLFKFPAVRVPVTAAFPCRVVLPSVVEPSVEDPDALRLLNEPVPPTNA